MVHRFVAIFMLAIAVHAAFPPVPGRSDVLDCPAIISRYAGMPAVRPIPLPSLPDDQLSNFSANFTIPLDTYLVDDTFEGGGSHYEFGPKSINRMWESAVAFWKRPLARRAQMTEMTDAWLIDALRTTDVRGMHVLVIGSTSPWHELLALAAGASHVSVLEYNRLTYAHDRISTYQPHELPADLQADMILSISSFQFSGLGRYGDPLDGRGDLQSMDLAACLLKPRSGRLLLSVPIGPDVVVYNLLRRYGRVRLPMLLAGWNVESLHGWDDRYLDAARDYRKTYKPVLVLSQK